MIWLKSGSSRAMTIAFGVAQFGRFGVVCVGVVSFWFANGLFPLGFRIGFQRSAFVVGSAARAVFGASVLTHVLFCLHF